MIKYTDLTIRERYLINEIFAKNADQSHLVKPGASMQAIADDYPGEVMDYGGCDPHMDMFVAVKELDGVCPMRIYRGVLSSLSQKGALMSDDWGQGEFWAITAEGWPAAVECNHREEMSRCGH